jgi:hypothetical protein
MQRELLNPTPDGEKPFRITNWNQNKRMNINTKSFMRCIPAIAIAIPASILMTACGGSGGDAVIPPVSPPVTPAVTEPGSNLVTQVPTPGYAAGSNELLAFERLNADRERCGFGKLAQNAKLDASAAAHRAYMVANKVMTHIESQALPGFTGVNPLDRDIAQGYSGSIQEDLTAGSFDSLWSFAGGDKQVALLAGGTYHAGVVTDGYRDVGLSWGANAFALEMGIPSGGAAQTASGVRTYPCEGSADVVNSISLEEPNPFPGQSTAWGPTISVIGDQVRISGAAITGPAGSVAIRAIYADGQQADPNGRCQINRACVIPVALQLGTTYQVQIAGTQGGQPFTKAFSFTTTQRTI